MRRILTAAPRKANLIPQITGLTNLSAGHQFKKSPSALSTADIRVLETISAANGPIRTNAIAENSGFSRDRSAVIVSGLLGKGLIRRLATATYIANPLKAAANG